jgi:hypothetical protein
MLVLGLQLAIENLHDKLIAQETTTLEASASDAIE